MMNYQVFATLYDSLMEEAPYDRWVDYIKRCADVDSLEGMQLLDVGCGTGELLVRLHEEGAQVAGVDLSPDMLAVAREKCGKHHFEPLLIEQSMTELNGLETFDLITLFCDSLNYLENASDVMATFERMNDHLKDGGLLLFDVHSFFKIEKLFIGQTFAEEGDDISYIWTSFSGTEEGSVEHELAFFVREDDGRYIKFEELHKQRTFRIEQYERWLEQAGFEVVSITADFTDEYPHSESERIFFCARKNKGI